MNDVPSAEQYEAFMRKVKALINESGKLGLHIAIKITAAKKEVATAALSKATGE